MKRFGKFNGRKEAHNTQEWMLLSANSARFRGCNIESALSGVEVNADEQHGEQARHTALQLRVGRGYQPLDLRPAFVSSGSR